MPIETVRPEILTQEDRKPIFKSKLLNPFRAESPIRSKKITPPITRSKDLAPQEVTSFKPKYNGYFKTPTGIKKAFLRFNDSTIQLTLGEKIQGFKLNVIEPDSVVFNSAKKRLVIHRR